MNDAVLLQNCFAGSEYIHLIELVFSRHARYCRFFKMDYRFEYSDILPDKPAGGDWGKIKMIERALEEYKYVIWMDSDAFIWNLSFDLRAACEKPANVVLYDNPFLLPAVGVMYWRSCPESKQMVQQWLATMPGKAPWWEQGEFQDLMAAGQWRDEQWVGCLDTKWNHTDWITQCESPIVLGFHGYAGVVPRMEQFRRYINAWALPTGAGVALPPLAMTTPAPK